MADSGPTGVGRPGLTDERLRLLEGLSYRAAMALQKALLARYREQSVHVADALLEFARALARAGGDDVQERIVRLAAELLDAREVSLWLQPDLGAELAPAAVWDEDPEHRGLLLEARFPVDIAQPFSERPEPFVLEPEQYKEIPGATELGREGTSRWRLSRSLTVASASSSPALPTARRSESSS